MEEFISDIVNMLNEELEAAQNKILGGTPDFNSYQKALGKYEAFKLAKFKFEEILQKHIKDQEEF